MAKIPRQAAPEAPPRGSGRWNAVPCDATLTKEAECREPERAGAVIMCVWDGTYTAPEEEREAMDLVPGWNDDAAWVPVRRRPIEAREPQPAMRRTVPWLKAA